MKTWEKREEFRKICRTTRCADCVIKNLCDSFDPNNAPPSMDDSAVETLWNALNPAPTIDDSQTAKADNGKPTYSLIPPAILDSIERVRAYGNAKYHDPTNWRQVEAQRYWEATLRHARAAWDDYTATDPESGLLHIEHMACNLAFLLQYISEGKA